MKNKILILTGAQGAGKDTLANLLKEDSGYTNLVLSTTRPMRQGEKPGVSYHFMCKDVFLAKQDNNEFVYVQEYQTLVNNQRDTWYYGLEQKYVKQALEQGKPVVVVLDPKNALRVHMGVDSTLVYLDLDQEVRKARVKRRKSFDKIEWSRREYADREILCICKAKADIVLEIDETESPDTVMRELLKQI